MLLLRMVKPKDRMKLIHLLPLPKTLLIRKPMSPRTLRFPVCLPGTLPHLQPVLLDHGWWRPAASVGTAM